VRPNDDVLYFQHKNESIYLLFLGFYFLQLLQRGINKARGIEQVRQFLNIDPQHIIAFGDEDNDIEMINSNTMLCIFNHFNIIIFVTESNNMLWINI
jgi:HAD superfamily hydrolase (TIGR01484 family)